MIKKKNYIEIILQIILIFAIFLLFSFEKFNLSKIYNIFSFKNLDLFLLIFFNHLAISVLFYHTLRFIIIKKLNIFKICSISMEGGIIKLIFPGGDLIYKYVKFKNIFKISFLQYSISQILFSISYKLSFFLLALVLGFIKFFDIKSFILIIPIMSIFVIFFILYYFRKKIYKFIKIKILSIEKIKNILKNLKIIKKIIFLNKKKFLNIFLLLFVLSIIQSYTFHVATIKFGIEIDIISSFIIYITSILITTLLYFNFIGVFEIILGLFATLISQNYLDIVLIGLSLRVLNIIALLCWVFIFSIINFKKKVN